MTKSTNDFRVVAQEWGHDREGRECLLTTCEELDPESGRWEPFLSISYVA